MSCRSAAFVLIALALASPVGAHHDFNLTFNWKSPVTLTGTVSRIVWAAPHVLAEVNVRDARGDVSVWQLEFGSPEALASYGWTANALVPGERVTRAIATPRFASKPTVRFNRLRVKINRSIRASDSCSNFSFCNSCERFVCFNWRLMYPRVSSCQNKSALPRTCSASHQRSCPATRW